MNNQIINKNLNALSNWFKNIGKCTIATSGGIDSMLLAYIAHTTLKEQVLIAHSTSASVPTLDAARVRHYAKKYQWQLALIQVGEIDNESYRNNPVNRCYYCKSCLFERLKALDHGALITGTNQDDLGDYRPGLIAAKEQGIKQPYVELGINKGVIRKIADHLQLHDLKDIPASPCLSSRIETGIKIDPEQLRLVDKIENYVRSELKTDIVRFRIRQDTFVLELAPLLFNTLSDEQKESLVNKIKLIITPLSISKHIQITTYQRGSAFIGIKNRE